MGWVEIWGRGWGHGRGGERVRGKWSIARTMTPVAVVMSFAPLATECALPQAWLALPAPQPTQHFWLLEPARVWVEGVGVGVGGGWGGGLHTFGHLDDAGGGVDVGLAVVDGAGGASNGGQVDFREGRHLEASTEAAEESPRVLVLGGGGGPRVAVRVEEALAELAHL